MLLDLDEVTEHTGGNVVYYGQAHSDEFCRKSLTKIHLILWECSIPEC